LAAASAGENDSVKAKAEPVFVGVTVNPQAEKAYVLCGAAFTL